MTIASDHPAWNVKRAVRLTRCDLAHTNGKTSYERRWNKRDRSPICSFGEASPISGVMGVDVFTLASLQARAWLFSPSRCSLLMYVGHIAVHRDPQFWGAGCASLHASFDIHHELAQPRHPLERTLITARTCAHTTRCVICSARVVQTPHVHIASLPPIAVEQHRCRRHLHYFIRGQPSAINR